jgi:hypothetical protein
MPREAHEDALVERGGGYTRKREPGAEMAGRVRASLDRQRRVAEPGKVSCVCDDRLVELADIHTQRAARPELLKIGH